MAVSSLWRRVGTLTRKHWKPWASSSSAIGGGASPSSIAQDVSVKEAALQGFIAQRPRQTGTWHGCLATGQVSWRPTRELHYIVDPDDNPTEPFAPPLQRVAYTVHKRGLELLKDPWYNKGTAFPTPERDRLGLRGLLPPRRLSMDIQEKRVMDELRTPREMIPPEDVKLGGVTNEMARRWKALQELQDRNETLFFKVLIKNFVDLAPIVYTPTVGWVAVNFHKLYRRPRGMYFSSSDRGEMAAMVYNWPQTEVSAIVVTDGSRILGLGDVGLNGLAIPVGKLDLYCAAAGFSPSRVLPVVIDVGTDNEELRNDPLYAGLRQPRITGKEYYDIMDEFVTAVMSRWPKAVLQFEDFSISHAYALLNRYRNDYLVFNDDIQGTASTALAGLYGALKVMGKTNRDLTNQRVVCVGAGSAGLGVVRMIALGMQKQGLSKKAAMQRFWLIDHKGLITSVRIVHGVPVAQN
ncbi:hypothetical protein DUNSADRAFT_2887 [Dunaliella salina]|uniref:Malic enzyme N-terminal domain-containing protein n=1 Tax=Dunaliella salina TaxID=3046 RepID=A0ABQ7GUX6_DUNSA|nr:hypothetical protein DUNSADRAFT_2887 [Dunaliella salina]|eukprot:KAF5838419.1 hypothetical protein DUNSADRAFT_2887 [Dunaliella salina]